MKNTKWLDEIQWNKQGLVPAIVQDAHSKQVLMLAWMNKASLLQTIEQEVAVFWSRSKKRLWKKGEQSGHIQKILFIYLDCDADALLLQVEQVGGIACHTGRASCFYRQWKEAKWHAILPIKKSPQAIYK